MEDHKIEVWRNKFETYLENHPSDDGSHDITHFKRVWKLAEKFLTGDEDKLVVLAACYFHDIVSYPKSHAKRSRSSVDAGVKAKEILSEMSFPPDKLSGVVHCIEAHSFSANIKTQTSEAQIVQDADRMESLGAIGLARTFYVAGRMGSRLFDGDDPFATRRALDDRKYAVDHFEVKLLKLSKSMKTVKGREEAQRRSKVLTRFLDDLRGELLE